MTFEVGDRVTKPKGYPFPGTVRAVFKTRSGETRVVVENDCGDLLHIFNTKQVEHEKICTCPMASPTQRWSDSPTCAIHGKSKAR